MQQFTDAEVNAKAVDLGLIDEGQELPRQDRGRVVAILMQQRRAAARPGPESVVELRAATSIVIQPDGRIEVDGQPFPWLIAKEPIDVRVAATADGVSTVRLTLLTHSVQIIKPEAESETAS